jgi:hypothetical protein
MHVCVVWGWVDDDPRIGQESVGKKTKQKRFSSRTGGAGLRRVGMVCVMMTMVVGTVVGRGRDSCWAGAGFVGDALAAARSTLRYPLRADSRLKTVYLVDPCVASFEGWVGCGGLGV